MKCTACKTQALTKTKKTTRIVNLTSSKNKQRRMDHTIRLDGHRIIQEFGKLKSDKYCKIRGNENTQKSEMENKSWCVRDERISQRE